MGLAAPQFKSMWEGFAPWLEIIEGEEGTEISG